MNGSAVAEPSESGKVRHKGGRTARVMAAVHEATLALLEERGYDRMEIPEIAERAQVNKTSIYRRWPSKMELVLEVALTRIGVTIPIVDTGSLQGDLIALLSRIALMLATPFAGGLLRALMASSNQNDDLQKARTTFWDARFATSGVIVERAIARGELPEGTNSRHLVEFAAAPLFYRTLVTNEAITDEDIWRVAQQACRAFR
ncbi:TetR/AcrR family transcriptional regulator [Aquirhabdus sp.]|uniref:TetR/AcrR family transcriptional regulator n=1 Tax=Aquirhabdus sp. TaxID=2824160 RepID=UPI00396CCE2A